MARRVFFSFHYADIWRVNVIRNSHIVDGTAVAGFQDGSLWEEAKKKGEIAIKRMIDQAMEGTTVTCVLIGQQTWAREYVEYEIQKSVERRNGLLGIRIHNIKNQSQHTDFWPGTIPLALTSAGAPVYDWDKEKFGLWIEDAYNRAQQKAKAAKPSWMR